MIDTLASKYQYVTRVSFLLILSFVLVLSMMALPVQLARAADLSVSYTSKSNLPVGSIVSADSQNSGGVVASVGGDESGDVVGVVVASSNLVLSQTGNSSQTGVNQVQISNSGTVKVLVSNINGPIKAGDRIAASSLSGIGMVATQSGVVIGTAQSDLSANTPGARTITVTSAEGQQKTVLVGTLPVALSIGFYQPPTRDSLLPNFLVGIANAIGGRHVPAGRLLASFIIMMGALIVVVILLSSGVRSSIGAIGRNPLAKRAIQGSLTRVIVLAALILVVCSTVSYLVLRG